MTTTADRCLSDFWRTDRSDDRVMELISVLRGSDNLIGLMGSVLRARWSGVMMEDGQRLSYTDLAQKIVALDYGPLEGQRTPFAGSKVDEVIGYAAHEGGHCLWTQPDKVGTIGIAVTGRYAQMPRSFQRDWKRGAANMVPDGDGGTMNPVLGELCRIQNILEDAYIDYHIAAKWEVLGEYVRTSRRRLAEARPIDLDAIARTARPDRNAAINLWVSIALYDYDIPKKVLTRMRRALTDLLALTERAINEPDGYARQAMAVEAAAILWREFPTQHAPLPTLPQGGQGQAGGGQGGGIPMPGVSGGAPGQSDGDSGGDSATGSSSGGGASKSDEDGDEAEGAGGAGDETEGDDAEGDEASTGGDDPDDADEGATDDQEDDRGDLVGQLADLLRQEAANRSQGNGGDSSDGKSDDDGDEGDGAGDEAGQVGNLDDFDDREVVPVPEHLLREILDAILHEIEDLSASVAEVLAEDPRNVVANCRKADDDPELARRVTSDVMSEVQAIRRVFDQQRDAATVYLRGQDRGNLDSRRLWKVGVGDLNVKRRRMVLETPDMAVGLLLDVSGSMNRYMAIVEQTAAVFAEGLIHKRGVNFAAWAYTGGRFEVALTRLCDRRMGKLCLRNVEKGGGTPSGAAMAGVKVLMDRMPERKKMLIHFTDGMPDVAHHVGMSVKACRDAGIAVYAIGVGGSMASSLEQQYGKSNWEVVETVDMLPGAMAKLLMRLDGGR